MARQDYVDAAFRERLHGHFGSSDDSGSVADCSPFERVMGDDYPGGLVSQASKPGSHGSKLAGIDPAVLDCKGPCSVDTDHCEFVINIKRIRICLDIVLVSSKRRERSREDVEERYVVIARHHNLWGGKRIEEFSCLTEFRPASSLGQITGYNYQIWFACPDLGANRIYYAGVRGAKM